MLLENLSLQGTIECVNKALKCIETRSRDSNTTFKKCTLRLQLILAKAYYKSNKKPFAIEIYNDIVNQDNSNLDALKGLAEIEFEDKNYSEAQKYVDLIYRLDSKNDWALAQLGYLHYLQNQLEEAKNRLLEAIAINREVAIYNHWLGIVYWKMAGEFQTNKKYAQTQFLYSAKLDPTFAANFTFLGHYYRIVEKDIDRAKKCYQKSLSLGNVLSFLRIYF
jgi:superkiller protein 3